LLAQQTTEEPMVVSDSVAHRVKEGMTESIAVGSSAGNRISLLQDEKIAAPVSEA